MPKAIIIGQTPWSDICRAALAETGWNVQRLDRVPPGDPTPPAADLYLLGCRPTQRSHWLKTLLRRRGSTILLPEVPADNASEADRWARAARKRRIRIGILGGWRFVPLCARLKEWTAAGIPGPIRRVDISLPAQHQGTRSERFAALDLAAWLADVDLAGAAPSATTQDGFLTFEGHGRMVSLKPATEIKPVSMFTVTIEAEQGILNGQARIPTPVPGTVLFVQNMTVQLGRRTRCVPLPAADSALSELLAACRTVLSNAAPDCVCDLDRSACLLAALERVSTPPGPTPAP